MCLSHGGARTTPTHAQTQAHAHRPEAGTRGRRAGREDVHAASAEDPTQAAFRMATLPASPAVSQWDRSWGDGAGGEARRNRETHDADGRVTEEGTRAWTPCPRRKGDSKPSDSRNFRVQA